MIILFNQDNVTSPIMVECRMADSGSGEPSPPPPNLVEAIAAMLTGRNEQTALLRQLVQQGAARGMGIIFTISRLFLGITSS